MSHEPARYDLFSRLLHWGIAAVMIYVMIVGYSLHFMTDARIFAFLRDQYVVGFGADAADGGALYLALFRPKVPYGDMLQGHQKGLVHLLHEIFYLLIFVVLLSGFLMLEHGFAVFGAIDFPRLIANLDVNRFFSPCTVMRVSRCRP